MNHKHKNRLVGRVIIRRFYYTFECQGGANCEELFTVVLTSVGIILISVLRDFLIMNLLSTFSEEQEAGIAFSFTMQREGNEARGANSSGGTREDKLPGRSPKQVPVTIQGEELTPKTLSTRNFKKRT